jgi:hypothetical protein
VRRKPYLFIVVFHEPGANWQKGESVDLVLRLDDGPSLPAWHAEVIDSASLGVFDAKNVWMMGKAQRSFSISAGGYERVFPATNFHAVAQPILQACGDSLEEGHHSMKTFLMLVTVFTPGQPTTNYQVTFSSSDSCEAARLQVINDAQRARQTKYDEALRSGVPQPMAALQATNAPSVSAVCVAQ